MDSKSDHLRLSRFRNFVDSPLSKHTRFCCSRLGAMHSSQCHEVRNGYENDLESLQAFTGKLHGPRIVWARSTGRQVGLASLGRGRL